jgi:superfamily II DNA/RNA helicase
MQLRDVIAGSKIGTWETLAFLLPAAMELLHVSHWHYDGACRKN